MTPETARKVFESLPERLQPRYFTMLENSPEVAIKHAEFMVRRAQHQHDALIQKIDELTLAGRPELAENFAIQYRSTQWPYGVGDR